MAKHKRKGHKGKRKGKKAKRKLGYCVGNKKFRKKKNAKKYAKGRPVGHRRVVKCR